jgi:hypothetical protein
MRRLLLVALAFSAAVLLTLRARAAGRRAGSAAGEPVSAGRVA